MIRRDFLLFLMITLGALVSGISQESGGQILQGYLLEAAENNPGLNAKFKDYMAAMEKVPQAGGLPDPQFAFGYFIQPVETRLGPQRATFGLSQTFPWFGSLGARKDAASELALSKYALFENAKSNLFFEVKTAFYQYYFMNKAIAITRENMEILRIFRNLSLVKIEAGSATVVDELRVELELNDLENQLAYFLDSKEVLQTRFNNLLQRDPEAGIALPEELEPQVLPYPDQVVLDSIYANNRELQAMDHRVNAFVKEEIVASKDGLPKFSLGVNYFVIGENSGSSMADNGKDAIMFPSVGLSIPIYRKKYKARIQEVAYLQEAEVERIEEKKTALHTLFRETYRDFEDSGRRMSLNERQAEIAKKVLDILITSYSTNSEDFEEVLRIERQLLGYGLAREKAVIDRNVSVAFINYLLGN